MLRKLIMALGAFFLFILQSCVFTQINMGGILPNLILLITCIYGFMHGEKAGMVTGFALGLISDILFGSFIGLNALILTFIGYLNGKFYGIYYPEDIKLPLGLVLTSNFSYGIVYYIFSYLIRGRLNLSYYFLHIILPEVLYTIITAIVIYPIVLLIERAFDKKEKAKKQSHA